MTWADHNQHGTACTRRKRVCCASSLQTANTVARLQAQRESRVLVGRRRPPLARRSAALHRGRKASRWCSTLSYDMGRLQPARHGVHASQAHVLRLLPTDSQRGGALAGATRKPGARWTSKTTACTSERGLAPKERGFSLVQCPSTGHGRTPICAAKRARVASARARSPRYRKPTQWSACVRNSNADCPLEASFSTSERGLAPKERGFSLVRCPSI